jgi:glutaredoxin
MILIFGKEYCPYCQNSRKIIKESNRKHMYFPLEKENNVDMVNQLRKYDFIPESHNTVPIVISYIKKIPKFIGGYDDLELYLSK